MIDHVMRAAKADATGIMTGVGGTFSSGESGGIYSSPSSNARDTFRCGVEHKDWPISPRDGRSDLLGFASIYSVRPAFARFLSEISTHGACTEME